jgi:glycosyltransferase involved in cell wall biosynthesis
MLHCTSNTAPLYTDIPLIITLHDIIYLENSPLKLKGTLYQKWGNFYRSHIVPKVFKNAAKILTVSHFEKNRIADFFGVTDGKLDAVYNGVSDHFFTQPNKVQINIAKIKYKLPKAYILFLGNTDPKKNIPRTLKAYEIYREKSNNPLPLVIADFSKENLVKVAQENGIHMETITHVHLIGYVPNPDLPVLYKLSSLFLYTSTRESFGIPILEAMACGIPVVTSNAASMPEVSGISAALANPLDSHDIADKMCRILSNTELKEKLIQRGLKRAENFRWNDTAMEVLRVYGAISIPAGDFELVA